ncbi:Sec1 domain containing protein 1 [Tritrichomonas musculus]|uniref:Sec1 domain containing protein 1 n=1 Tax=Tritrichomonas musculus TaxID=1915356 RepID=A0ABR2HY38_9EUKA
MLRSKHRALVQQILNCNQPLTEADHQASLRWKVLIYDQRGLSILSTLFKVSKLLEVGVTFYGLITQKREQIPDVSAIYFLEPTPDNLRLIAQDCAEPLYDQMYINFLDQISSQDLGNFASQVSQFSNCQCIHSIFDQYIEFSSLDPNLFTLFGNAFSCQTNPNTYMLDRERDDTMQAIFGFKTTEETMENMCKIIGHGLASVFLTAGEIPRVLYKKKNLPANLIYQSFSEVIKLFSQNFELWESRRSEFYSTSKPPLLIIFDRSIDFASLLHHPCTYQALIHDQFGINKNEVKINGEFFDLDTDIDKIWAENRSKTFDTVLEVIGKEAAQFRTEYGAIENNINSALNNLSDLSHMRLSLATHTKISDALVKVVKKKQADNLFKFEEDIVLHPGTVDVTKLIEFLKTIPEQKDRVRLATFAFICKVFEIDQIERVQIEGQIDSDLRFLKRYNDRKIDFKKDNKITSIIKSVPLLGSQSDSNAFAEKIPVVDTTKRLCMGRIEGFDYKNPINSTSDLSEGVGNVYVFIIGPGNYVEYNGLMELGRQNNIDITYGCTSMMRPCDFIESLQL